MAADGDNLTSLAHGRHTFTMWHYWHDGPAREVVAGGFWDPLAYLFNPGDLIQVTVRAPAGTPENTYDVRFTFAMSVRRIKDGKVQVG